MLSFKGGGPGAVSSVTGLTSGEVSGSRARRRGPGQNKITSRAKQAVEREMFLIYTCIFI